MGAAAAVIVRRERRIVDQFRRAGATSPATARTPDDLDVTRRLAFQRLVRRAILRDAGGGRYYVDESSWIALRRRRRRAAFMMAVIVVVLFVAAVLAGVVTLGTGLPTLH